MSNTRVFNYQEITSIYDQMNQIIGDSSDPSTIAGLLHKIDEDYHEVVNGPAGEDELALRGDLGMQLLNNWENTAGSFPAFVENFSSWSTLVAQTAGDYSAFEEQVRGIRSNNPLGWNTGGIQNGYVASSSYTNSFTDAELDEAAAGVQMYNLVGAYYVDTGMVSYAKKQAFWNGFGDVLSVVSIVASGCSLVKGLGVIGGAAKGASAGAGLIDDGAKAGAGLIDDGAKAGAGLIDDGAKAGAGLIDDGAKVAGQSLDDLVAGGKPIANSTLYGLSDETAAAATDKLISKGYTLVDDTWQLPTNINASNSMFAQSVDDFILNGQSVPNSALSSFPGETVGSATDKLINSGYTLSGGTWQAPASMVTNSAGVAAAPSIANGSALGDIADDVAKGSVDDLIAKGYTMGADGAMHAPASALQGAPSRAATSAIAHPIYDKAPSVVAKGTYYAQEGIYKGVDAVKNGASAAGSAIKNGWNTAGGAIKNGWNTASGAIKSGAAKAGTYIKDAGVWVKENGVTVLKETATKAGTSGMIGLATNTGQNIVNNANIRRNAEMVANARAHFENNGN